MQMTPRLWYRTIACLLLCASVPRGPNSTACGADRPQSDKVIVTSLVSVLANPSQYNGKAVQVAGVYILAQEHSALYLTKEHAAKYDFPSSIWVELGGEESHKAAYSARNKFIEVTGRLCYEEGKRRGHFGMWAIELRDVTFRVVRK